MFSDNREGAPTNEVMGGAGTEKGRKSTTREEKKEHRGRCMKGGGGRYAHNGAKLKKNCGSKGLNTK